LADFEKNKALYEGYRRVCHGLIEELLRLGGFGVHSVTSRVKERSSLRGKLGRTGKNYRGLQEITDIVGIRVITHFEDDVDRIGALIEHEFEIDRQESIDKRKLLDPDRFGYLSLHYICSLTGNRLKLPEFARFADMKCEVQLRSILQHAWAEIEHDLGYKAGATVPAPIRRRFSRLAGLLEIADCEFTQLRDELASYESRVADEIKQSPSSVQVDDVSLKALIESDSLIGELSRAMADFVNANLMDVSVRTLQALPRYLQYVEISTIQELREAMSARKELILGQWRIRMRSRSISALDKGIAIFHLVQVVLAETGDVQKVAKALGALGLGAEPGQLVAAREIVHAVDASRLENG
jgi:ppGpp synthetase/RelA/SpoT-type nucleotidyltranferase